mgnify:CR=1 FL=1|jgi:hypothetical protein
MWKIIYHDDNYESIVEKFYTFKEAKSELYNRIGLCSILGVKKITDIYSIRKE